MEIPAAVIAAVGDPTPARGSLKPVWRGNVVVLDDGRVGHITTGFNSDRDQNALKKDLAVGSKVAAVEIAIAQNANSKKKMWRNPLRIVVPVKAIPGFPEAHITVKSGPNNSALFAGLALRLREQLDAGDDLTKAEGGPIVLGNKEYLRVSKDGEPCVRETPCTFVVGAALCY